MQYRELLERVEVADLVTRSGNHLEVRLHWNPSASTLSNLVDRSEDKEQRGLFIDPQHVVFWDSWYAQHDLVARWLNQQGYDIPMDGTANILVDAHYAPPVIWISKERAKAPVIQHLASKFKLGS